MLDDAHYILSKLEDQHWWYVGARAVYRILLELGFGPPQGGLRMLEVGCGSGGNLALLQEFGNTAGLEYSSLAINLVSFRPRLGLIQASAEALPFAENSFDGVHYFGVIEHLHADKRALQEGARVCRRDGAICLLTSALPILWSRHDEANLHRRRYTRRQLKAILIDAGLVPEKISYQNFFTFLPTLLVRLWQRLNPSPPRYDMSILPGWLNALMIRFLLVEAEIIRSHSLPIGVDLVAMCRPRKPIS